MNAKELADKIEADGLCCLCDYGENYMGHGERKVVPFPPDADRELIVKALRAFAPPEVAPQFSPQFWCKSQNTVGGEHEGVPCCTQCASCELEQCKRRVAELESAPGAPRSPPKE